MSLFGRLPRFTLLVLFATLAVFILFFSRPPESRTWHITDHSLPARLQMSHQTYDKRLKDRQGLIKKFGPHPTDVMLFPPDKAPWPPYTVWDFFTPAFNCPHEVERLGALGDGGKWICGLSRIAEKPNCIIYSFGINHESSFEAEVLSNTRHCQVWGYDPTVSSFGPEITFALSQRTHFRSYGLSGQDTISQDNRPMYSLESLMKMNGHTHIDILKIDIESWEFDAMTSFLKPYIDSGKPLPFGQLSMEIHLWDRTFEYFLGWWEMLEAAGLRPFWTEPNLVYVVYSKTGTPHLAEYSFLNVKGDNVFIKDPPPYQDDHESA